MEGLRELSVRFSQFEGLLPESLTEMLSSKFLDLSSNNFYGFILSTLSNYSNLVGLNLSFNHLNGSIPFTLGSLSNLRNLIIWLTQLIGEITRELASSLKRFLWIGKLLNLPILKLSNNLFFHSISPKLGDCLSLIWLNLNTKADRSNPTRAF
ncbi:hypothetical protein HN51_000306 [Arachis hypogaea]|nr:Protein BRASSINOSTEROID INSENSITIVE [Arachis hypogaea]